MPPSSQPENEFPVIHVRADPEMIQRVRDHLKEKSGLEISLSRTVNAALVAFADTVRNPGKLDTRSGAN